MPVFNHESYIDETLDAIQAQTGPRYEIICIDQ
jgi:glycosyltransferase involved in cell wall biosynthesis